MPLRIRKDHNGHPERKSGIDSKAGVDGNDSSQRFKLLVEHGGGVGCIIRCIARERALTDARKSDGGTTPDKHKEHHAWRERREEKQILNLNH